MLFIHTKKARVCVCASERDTETERQRGRQTDRERDRQTQSTNLIDQQQVAFARAIQDGGLHFIAHLLQRCRERLVTLGPLLLMTAIKVSLENLACHVRSFRANNAGSWVML